MNPGVSTHGLYVRIQYVVANGGIRYPQTGVRNVTSCSPSIRHNPLIGRIFPLTMGQDLGIIDHNVGSDDKRQKRTKVMDYKSIMDATKILGKAWEEVIKEDGTSPSSSYLFHAREYLYKQADLIMRGE